LRKESWEGVGKFSLGRKKNLKYFLCCTRHERGRSAVVWGRRECDNTIDSTRKGFIPRKKKKKKKKKHTVRGGGLPVGGRNREKGFFFGLLGDSIGGGQIGGGGSRLLVARGKLVRFKEYRVDTKALGANKRNGMGGGGKYRIL